MKTREAKKKHNKRKYDKLKEDTLIARKQRHMRQGTYRKGMHLEDDWQDLLVKKKKAPLICPHPFCGLKGHKTICSKKCRANPQRLQNDKELKEQYDAFMTVRAALTGAAPNASEEGAGINDDADDLEMYDTLPLQANSSPEKGVVDLQPFQQGPGGDHSKTGTL